jgi:hypothetical protein
MKMGFVTAARFHRVLRAGSARQVGRPSAPDIPQGHPRNEASRLRLVVPSLWIVTDLNPIACVDGQMKDPREEGDLG